MSLKRPSLENLSESADLGFGVLHPGGLEITGELATPCYIEKDSKILDVAVGTGESACYLQENLASKVVGIDASDDMVERARKKTADRHLSAQSKKGAAHSKVWKRLVQVKNKWDPKNFFRSNQTSSLRSENGGGLGRRLEE